VRARARTRERESLCVYMCVRVPCMFASVYAFSPTRKRMHPLSGVLQCVAVCCSVLQCVAMCCNVLPETHASAITCVAECCRVLQSAAVCCSVLPEAYASAITVSSFSTLTPSSLSCSLIERTPPPGGVSYLLCFLIKNREEEDPP